MSLRAGGTATGWSAAGAGRGLLRLLVIVAAVNAALACVSGVSTAQDAGPASDAVLPRSAAPTQRPEAAQAGAMPSGTAPAGTSRPAAAVDPDVVEFIRVRVPRGRLQDIPVGAERHVPLSAAEFDKALGRLGAGAARADRPRSLPASARYELRPDPSGGLVGRVTIEVRDAAPGRFLRLGPVRAIGGSVRTDRGAGAAVVFGLADGAAALATPEPGTYAVDVVCPPPVAGDGVHRLPLVGGLTTTIVVEQVPAQARLLVSADAGGPLVRRLETAAADASWVIDVGPATAVAIEIVDRDRPAPRVAIWTRATVRGAGVGITAQLVPAGPWNGEVVVLAKSPAVRPTAVRVAGRDERVEWREADEGNGLTIEIPAAAQSRATPLVVEAVAPVQQAVEWVVPGFGLGAAAWGGGGVELTVEPTLVIESIEPAGAGCRLVTPEVAGRWPLPIAAAASGGDGEQAAQMCFEMQRHSGAPRVVLRRRSAQFDVARVTTVELTPALVVARAACDVRVVAGEAFGIEGQIMQGWFIDSVEAIDWGAARESDAVDRQRGPVAESRVLEWVEQPARGGVRPLRIAFDGAATPARGVGLRITGHRRPGVPVDAAFETGDMDMVRFVGESADTAVIDFRPTSEALVEIGGTPVGMFDVGERLLPLVEETAPRGRIPGGDRGAAQTARLVKRRPPLDADVAIDVAVREETVTETFRFTCQTSAAPIDSFVVQFSAPMGDDLDWSLEAPAGAGVVARRVEPTDAAGPRDRSPGESWLVEVSPAVVGRVRVRASRAVPAGAAVPLPLAWVEAAQRPGGTVLVRGVGTSRPGVRNRRLRELPPTADAPAGTVAEFAFDDGERRAGSGPAAAEIIAPAADTEPRAWVWHEESAVWCHDSGATEIESRFDIENHGRDAVALRPLPGRRILEVLIDGRPLDLPNLDAAGASLRVPLPAGRSRLVLEIRALARHAPRLGCWWVDTAGCTIDAPVLDRRLRLLLPPELEAVTLGGRHREIGATPRGWSERLFGIAAGFAAAPAAGGADTSERPVAAPGSLVVGFRSRWFVPTTEAADAVGIGIVRRRLLDASATVSAWLVLVAASIAARRSRAACILLCAGLALVTLWTPAPFDLVTRVAWWAGVCGVLLAAWSRGLFRRQVVVGVAIVLVSACPVPTAAAEQGGPLKVFVIPGAEGDDVLVPERLFRLLAAAPAEAGGGVRVVACRVRADVATADGPWTLELDVDVDPGGRAMLDQRPCGARWLPAVAGAAPVSVRLDAGDRVAQLLAAAGGRHAVRLAVRPAIERRGDVEFMEVCLPPAARAAVEFVDDKGRSVRPAAESLQCDAARPGDPWLRVMGAEAADGLLDVSGAARVRLVRPADRRDRLVAGGPRDVRGLNEVSWNLDACGLQATFDIDPGAGILRSFVVATTPGLEPLPDPAPALEPAFAVVPLGAGRQLVEFRQPRRGAASVRLGFRTPLVDPVGTFTVPEARIEGTVSAIHEVRLTAAADLDVDVEIPAAAVPATPGEGEPLRSGWAWRTLRAEGRPAADAWARLSVRRKPQEVRATQHLAVEFGAAGSTLRLRAKLDALTVPLGAVRVEVPVGFTVSRAVVVEDDVLGVDAAVRGPLDVAWTVQDDELAIVVQRPRAGRFRLEVDAGSTVPPPARGPLPLLRAMRAGGAPLAVAWRQTNGSDEVARHALEVSADGPVPEYELATMPLPSVEPPEVELPRAATPAAAPEWQEGVLLARVHAAVDDAGRLRCVVRFDLLAGGGSVRLRLPAGTRLFDVLVDGREVQPIPAGADVWEVRLHDALWPRAVSVVFGAEGGSRGPAGLVRFAAPTIDGLRGREVAWTIDPPPGAVVQVAAPSRPLDEAAWRDVIAAGEARLVAAFGAVIAATPEPIRSRFRAFADTLATGPASDLEASWDDALPRLGAASRGRVHGLAAADGTIACRIERLGDASLPSRVLVSMALVAVIGLVRAAAVRRRRDAAAG